MATLVAILACAPGIAQTAEPAGQSTTPQNTPPQNSPQAQTPEISSSNAAAGAAAHPALDLTPDASGNLSDEQMRQLTRVVVENYRDNYKKLRDYTYIDHEISRHIDGKGQVKSTEIRTYELMELYGEPVARLIEKDDKPLSEKDAAKEEERIQKLADKWKNENEEDREKREAEKDKQRQKNRDFIAEVPDAYTFRLVGSEKLNGRDNWVIAGEPRPDFHARTKDAQILPKFHGTLWIDKAELQLAKMEIEAVDTASVAWGMARIHKGTRVEYEQMRVNDEVWLPQHYEAKLDLRLLLFKSDNEQDEGTFRDYKKFRASSKIVSIGEGEGKK